MCSRPASARSSAAASARSGSRCSITAWPRSASTGKRWAGTAICAATAACRTPASGSASSAPSPTSPASPTCATPFRSHARPATRNTELLGFDALGLDEHRVTLDLAGKELAGFLRRGDEGLEALLLEFLPHFLRAQGRV